MKVGWCVEGRGSIPRSHVGFLFLVEWVGGEEGQWWKCLYATVYGRRPGR